MKNKIIKQLLFGLLALVCCTPTLLSGQDVQALLKTQQNQAISDYQKQKKTQTQIPNNKFKNSKIIPEEKEEPSELEKDFESREKEEKKLDENITEKILRPSEEMPTKNLKHKYKPFLADTNQNEYTSNQEEKQNDFEESEEKKDSNNSNTDLSNINTNTKTIKQFGYDIFKTERLDAIQSGGVIPVNPDYLLGPGDHLQIRIWGKIEQVIESDVDAQGNIFIPKAGLIPVAGVRYSNINSVIKNALSSYYVNLELNVALTNLRTIRVFVLGYVAQPGAYDISSLSSLFSALYASGGPTKTGSLRRIQLKRNGKTYKTVDLYDYLLKGDNKQDPTLKPFDTIFVPAIGDVVKIQGAVKQPAIYEIAPKTSMFEAITDFAGGFGTHSFNKKIHVERINQNSEREFFDIFANSSEETKSKLKKITLKNGDVITIEQINFDITNSLEVKGNVKRPGPYAFKESMTLNELFALCDGLKEGSASHIQVFRYVSDEQRELITLDLSSNDVLNFKLMPKDVIKVPTEIEEKGKDIVIINGAVKKPGKYYLLKNMTITDLLALAQLEDFSDLGTAELYRKNKNKPDEVFQIDLSKILSNPSSSSNIMLQNNDQLSIRINNKLLKVKKITLTGEFKYPGVYIALENEKLDNIIKRAGGFTPKAFKNGVIFKRSSITRLESDGNKLILEEEKKRMIYDQNRNDTLNKDTQLIYNSAIAFLQEKIENSNGRLILDLNAPNFESSQSNLILEDGDKLFVPETPNSVQIVGGVQLPTSILYQDGKKPDYYIAQAGNYSEYAKKGKYYVFRADGTVVLNTKTIQRGDTIYVPEEIKLKTNWLQNSSIAIQTIFTLLASLKLLNLL